MLVLTTKMEDGVQIGEDIRITIVDVRPRNVRLGIEAPRSVAIKRDSAASSCRRVATSVSQQHCRDIVSETEPMSLFIVCRDQPLLSRLNALLKQDRAASEPLVISSMTDAKKRIDARQALGTDSRPTLLLLDIDLSPQTAIVFLRWLRQSEFRREIAVVAMRSEQTPHTNASLLASGANVVVNKDQPWNRIHRCLRAAIDLWQNCAPPDRVHTASLKEAVA